MNLRELINATSLELSLVGAGDKAVEPIVVSLLNVAYATFVEEIGNVDDVLTIAVSAGAPKVLLPSSVLKVKWATLESKELEVVNRNDSLRLGLTAESPCEYLMLGDVAGEATLLGSPKVSGELQLGILRGANGVLEEDTDTPTDISAPRHLALCDWVVWKITGLGDKFASFSAAVAAEKARNLRQRTKPVRTVRYGGI